MLMVVEAVDEVGLLACLVEEDEGEDRTLTFM